MKENKCAVTGIFLFALEKNGCEKIIINDHIQHKNQKLYSTEFISLNKQGDLVLDPFSGSGTTAVVGKKLQRNFIGIEKDKDCRKLSKERLKNTKVLKEEVITIAKAEKNYQKFLW